MDGGGWWAAVHGVAKSLIWLNDFTFLFLALEKEMATHSSVLAWRIPEMAESGGLPSMGSHRVGHYWSNLAAAAAACGCIDFPGGSDCKESPCNARDPGLTPGSGRSLGEGKGYPLQCSCQGNPMDRGVWRATVHGVTESDTTEWLGTRSLRQLYCYRSCLRLFSNGFIPEILPPKHQCHFLTHSTISRVMASLLGWLRSDNESPLTAPSSLPVEYLSGLSVLNTKQYNFKLS